MDRRYTIKTASRMTGITPDTIRVWERRYGAVEPGREENGRRFYTDEDIRRLRLMKRATEMGAPIREVARLSQTQLEGWVTGAAAIESDSERPGFEPGGLMSTLAPEPGVEVELINRIIAALERFDSDEIDRLLNSAVIAMPPEALIRNALFPLLRAVGDRWFESRLTVAQEHLLSARLRSLSGALMQAYPRRASAGKICFATLPGERHEFGVLLCCWLAILRGWRCDYLGPDLPSSEIAEAAVAGAARIVALSAVVRDSSNETEKHLRRLRMALPVGVEIWIGGPVALDLRSRVADIRNLHTADLASFIARLERYDNSPLAEKPTTLIRENPR